jgi:hypothetical protein
MKNSLKTILVQLNFVLLLIFGAQAAQAQGVDTSLASSLLKGSLQNFLISNLAGRLGTVTVSERFNFSNGSLEIGSRKLITKQGTFDQITIKITEAGKTQFINVAQAADGKLSQLSGGQLVAISGGNPLSCVSQLFGAASSCAACKTKITNCIAQNNTFLARARCVGRSFDGTCISCGVSLFAIYTCLRG